MKSKFWHLMVFLALIVSMLPVTVAAAPAEPEAAPQTAVPEKAPASQAPTTGVAPIAQAGNGVQSLSGSTVTFAPSVGGDVCYIPGATQTFCFNAHSLTADWEYVYNVWVKFPTDWTVTNAYVQGTPACTGGGTWSDFSWSFQTSPYEVNISHARYQAYTDDCTAYYCFEVVAGAPQPFAGESWFWDGDGYNYTPHWPCSSDQYTPAGQSACDEYVNPLAQVPVCAMDPGVYLLPETQEAEGCNGVAQEHTVSVYNNTGTDGTFAMSYSVPSTNGTLTGPATVFAAQGAVAPFVVTLTPDLCAQTGALVVGQVNTSGNGFTDSAVINKTVTTGGNWETVASSAPAWAGNGYASDGCTAVNGSGQTVTYLIGDMSGTGPVGFWGYNHTTNAWFQPAAANTPADRWAPDWAYDSATNLCYLTGGANTPGAGTYNAAYVYDPVANAFTALPSFTSIRDFHDSWIGTVDGVKYLCIGGGNNGSGMTSTQCYGITAGTWAAENATIGAYPTDIWGAADGVLHAAGGDQLWTVAGAQTGSMIADAAFYFDDADNAWHAAGNTGVARYRVEGDFYNGAFYQVAGSDGTFTGTTDVRRGANVGGTWTWEAYPNVPNRRMDNIANVAGGTLWSIEGYGSTAANYVDYWAGCPICDLQGWLEGTVLDGDTQIAAAATSSPFVPVKVEGNGDKAPITVASPALPLVKVEPAANPEAILWDQPLSTVNQNAYVNQDFSDLATYSSFLADDFVNADPWNISTIFVPGNGWNGFTTLFNATALTWQVYADCAGVPCGNPAGGGNPPVWTLTLALTDPQVVISNGTGGLPSNTTLNLAAPVTVPPGHWWLVFYPTLPFSGGGQFGRQPADTANGYFGQFINPGGSFGYGTVWQAWTVLGVTQHDIAFRIEGVTGGGSLGPTCTGATVTINPGNITLPTDPATGHYGPVMLIQGEYTVEATAPGYSTETATVQIVDEMTTTQDFILWRPVIDVDPIAPISVSAEPSETVTVPLTISNLGHLPLDWEIIEVPGNDTPKAAAGDYKQTPAATGMDPFILEEIAQSADGKADVFVAFKDTADLSGAYVLADKATKIQFVRTALRQAADTAQAGVRAWLDGQEIDYKVFYVDNTLLIKADKATLDKLAAFPEVSGFHGNHTYEILPTEVGTEAPEGSEATIPWDLTIMSIPQVWDMGVTGEGVIVANVDTGVYYQHEALLPNYLCGASGPHTDCWEDPDGGTTAPNDGNGHGTGTMSQMAADNNAAFQYAVGGAPDAGWIACLGCPGGSCPDTALNGCADWLVMTTPNTPDIVNNSWGTWSALCDSWYDGKIDAYRAAGVVPVWAAGNIGNACSTSTPPANSIGTLAVGATTSGDVQASFSSTGPGLCTGRTQFPDVSAPGDATCGATNSGGYTCSLGGTSFAAPRAAGCLALMKSAAPWMGVQELMDAIMATADDKPNTDCGSPQDDPNYRYGEGRVNCFEAVSAVYAADLDWVSEVPVSGTLPALGVQPVDVVFHCGPEQEGWILTGTLRINHNDPCADSVEIPIEMICGQSTDPDIEVVPPALSSIQLQNEQVVQTLNINNLGSADLDWTIIEHNPGLALAPAAPSAPQTSRPVELKLEAAGGASVETNPPVVDAPVILILDDGSRDNDIGIGGTLEMLWVNRFTPAAGDFPFNLNQIQIYFSAVGMVNVGDDIVLLVYENTSGNADPAVGSNLLAAIPTTVQALDTWNVYNLATPIYLAGPGDVLIGAIGMEIPGTSYWPASIDQTATQARSWAGWWNASPPPSPPILPPENWTLIDAYFPGNWMVRGYGETSSVEPPPECEPVDIPWATVDPTSGTTPGHDTFAVDVTFDSTAMASGTYTANLCVESNDPDEPFVIVPLTMTVMALQNIVVTPPSLTEELCPDATATQPLTICNTGDVPLTWSLVEVEPVIAASAMGAPTRVAPQANTDTAPTSRAPIGTMALGDLLFEIQAEAAAGNNLLLGVEYAFGHYWVTGGDPGGAAGWLYKIDPTGALVGTYSQAAACTGWGGRDLAFDGTYLYYGCDNSTIYQVDPVTGAPTGVTISAPISPPRALAYDPASDSFWTASWDSTIYNVNRSGSTIGTCPPVGLSTYGFGWDTWSAGGPFLWFWSQDGPDPLLQASQFNPATCSMTGVTWLGSGVSGEMAGGFAITDEAVPGMAVFVGMNQGVTDRIGVYELGQTFDAPWLSEDPVQGTIPGGECQVIDVTFDATGLAAGDYFVDLLITSNDPDTPEIIVPVQLTVLESVTIDNVTFTRDGLEVTFDATVSGGAPFTYAWDFGDGYTSAVEDPVHVYAAAGCYSVTLTVSNQCGEATWGPTQVCVESPFLYYYLPLITSNYPAQ